MFTIFRNYQSEIRQFLRLAFISGTLFLAAALLILSVLAYVYRDSIKNSFVAALNQGLKTEIFVDDISVNVFRSFPLASLTLSNVRVMDNTPQKDTLLLAHRVYLQFSILDMLRKNYKIRQVEISRADLRIKVFADGSNNYSFWESDPEAPPKDFSLQLQRVLFNQVEFRYHDLANKHQIALLLRKASLRGNFSMNSYRMSMEGNLFLDQLVLDNVFMVGQKDLTFDLGFDVANNNHFEIRQGNFRLGNHVFVASGHIDLSGQDTWVDLSVAASQLRLDHFIRDLPPVYARYFEGYRSKGEFYFDAQIKGTFSSVVKPFVSANFGIRQGELFHRRANLRLENISFDASFNNGSQRSLASATLTLTDFHTNLNKGRISGGGSMHNFLVPELDFKLYSDINADEWARFLQWEQLPRASGKLLVDLEFKGKLGSGGSFSSHNFMASKVQGVVKAEDLSFRLKNDPLEYNGIFADLLFNNNDIVIREFSGNASSSDFDMTGYFRNVIPWLFLDNERLMVDARLRSANLNFNELLQHNVSESDTTYKLALSEKIDFRFAADVDQLNFRKFEAQQVKGALTMRNQVFHASSVSLHTMQGRVTASGYINGQNPDRLVIGCDARFHNVDVHDLFYQMGNFGQEAIVADNLRGRITADTRFISHWNPYLEIDWNALEVTADIRIEQGELINYKPMLALSRFIRVGDLNQVRFSTLENQIRIKNQKIIIPDMEINSDAINIKLSGEHTFQNEINYRLQVLLSDLLARRNRQSRNPQEQYGDIIDDGLGRTTLFLLVTGTIDDPVFRYDRQGVREKLRDDFRRERETLRDAFRTEFGISRSDTLNDRNQQPTQRQKEQQEIRQRERGRFVIEWDED